MNISEAFIRRPVATALLMAGLALAGIAAFRLLPVAPLPPVDFPTISVSASLPGASPETMASAVATPLEREFGVGKLLLKGPEQYQEHRALQGDEAGSKQRATKRRGEMIDRVDRYQRKYDDDRVGQQRG